MARSAFEDGYAIGVGEKVSSMKSMTRTSRNYKTSIKIAIIDMMTNSLQKFCQAKLTIRRK